MINMTSKTYPNHLVSSHRLVDGTVITIRPIRPQDVKLEQEFIRHLSSQAKHFRFMENFRELTFENLVRLTHIDYEHEMAFIATHKKDDKEIDLGVASYVPIANSLECEFAIVIADG